MVTTYFCFGVMHWMLKENIFCLIMGCVLYQIMEEFLKKNYSLLIFLLVGLILIGLGVLIYKNGGISGGSRVEVLNSSTDSQNTTSEANPVSIVVEITGAVEKPGVYRLPIGSRIDDLLIISGGVSVNANREWIEKNINRASKLTDGQKLYIYSQSDVLSANTTGGIKPDQGILGVENGSLLNINTASLNDLDTLPGIGPVYGQSIIEHRPYSTIEELLSKGVLKKSVYEKIKNKITAM